MQSEVSRIRRNVRELLSVGSVAEDVKERMIGRLTKLGITNPNTTLDNLLDLKENDLLNRRLQTVVFKKGMARSIRQARQITVHGFISINGRKVNRPGYLVDTETEKRIAYYKPIDVAPPKAAGQASDAEKEQEDPTRKQQPTHNGATNAKETATKKNRTCCRNKGTEGERRRQYHYEAKAMGQEIVRPKAERWAVAHVYSSKNDTIITLTRP